MNGKEEEIRESRDSESSAHNVKILNYLKEKERSGNTIAIVNALNQILSKLAEAIFAEKGRSAVLSEI